MVGRELSNRYPPRTHQVDDSEVFFEIRNWNVYHPEDTSRQIIKDANLQLRKGEVVGLSGLMGAGRTELAMSVFGKSYGSNISGEVYLRGQKINTDTVAGAIKHGIAYLSEDRKTTAWCWGSPSVKTFPWQI